MLLLPDMPNCIGGVFMVKKSSNRTTGKQIYLLVLSLVILLVTMFPLRVSAEELGAQVILDNKFARITFLGIQPSIGVQGYFVDFEIENKTNNKIQVSLSECFVNNYMCSSGFSGTYITPGNAAKDRFLLPTALAYETVYNIGFRLSIEDKATWEDVYESEPIIVTVNDEYIDSQIPPAISVPTPIIDNEYVCIAYLSAQKLDGVNGRDVFFHIENKTENRIFVSIEDSAINGYMCDAVTSDCMKITGLNRSIAGYLFHSFDDIDQVTDMEYRFVIYDDDTHKVLFRSKLFRMGS